MTAEHKYFLSSTKNILYYLVADIIWWLKLTAHVTVQPGGICENIKSYKLSATKLFLILNNPKVLFSYSYY